MNDRISIIIVLFLLVATQHNAMALTAQDVMQKMSTTERFGYLTGLVDMLSYQYVLAGDRKRAKCITAKFYDDKAMQSRIFKVFERYPDKAPEGIMVLLMNKACGA